MGTLVLFGRTFLALALVLALVWGLSRLMRRGQNGGMRRRAARPTGGHVEVLSRKSLSRTTAVVLVRVGGRTFVLGTTPQSVTLISEMNNELDLSTEPRETDRYGRQGRAKHLGHGMPPSRSCGT